jgi:hypothetical protein
MKSQTLKVYLFVLVILSVISLIALIKFLFLALYSVNTPWIPSGSPLWATYNFDYVLFNVVAIFVLLGWMFASLVFKYSRGKSRMIVLFSVMLVMELLLLTISIKLRALWQSGDNYDWAQHFSKACQVSGLGLLVGGLWAFTKNQILLNWPLLLNRELKN